MYINKTYRDDNKILCDFDVLKDLRKAAKAAIMLGREFKIDVEFIWEGITHCISNADYIIIDEIIENHRIRKENSTLDKSEGLT